MTSNPCEKSILRYHFCWCTCCQISSLRLWNEGLPYEHSIFLEPLSTDTVKTLKAISFTRLKFVAIHLTYFIHVYYENWFDLLQTPFVCWFFFYYNFLTFINAPCNIFSIKSFHADFSQTLDIPVPRSDFFPLFHVIVTESKIISKTFLHCYGLFYINFFLDKFHIHSFNGFQDFVND